VDLLSCLSKPDLPNKFSDHDCLGLSDFDYFKKTSRLDLSDYEYAIMTVNVGFFAFCIA
jgi:hypothetical protein